MRLEKDVEEIERKAMKGCAKKIEFGGVEKTGSVI